MPSNAAATLHSDHVIIGGGAGGLLLAARLGRKLGPDRVLLIDRAVTHIWKPSLHEIVAGTRDSHQDALPYPVLARRNGFRFALGELAALDPGDHRLTLAPVLDAKGESIAPERSVTYGRLVLATGAGTNLFGTDGADAHTFRIEDADDARRLNRRLTDAFLGAAFSEERVLRISIIGAGPTGVQLAAELDAAHADVIASLAADQHFKLEISLLEMAPSILGGQPEAVTRRARAALDRLGVRLMTGAEVIRVRAGIVETADGAVPADIVIWTAGARADKINPSLGLKTGKLNQIVVNERLETSATDVWALGDCAEAPGPGERPLPPRAQVAAQQARYLARVLMAREAGQTAPEPFVFRERGSLISLGREEAVGAVQTGRKGGRLFIEGMIADWLQMSLLLDHHRAILGVRRTVLLALARMLQAGGTGRTRLH